MSEQPQLFTDNEQQPTPVQEIKQDIKKAYTKKNILIVTFVVLLIISLIVIGWLAKNKLAERDSTIAQKEQVVAELKAQLEQRDKERETVFAQQEEQAKKIKWLKSQLKQIGIIYEQKLDSVAALPPDMQFVFFSGRLAEARNKRGW